MRRFFLLLLVSTLPAQDVSERMSVILRDVRVHVVDKNGKPVTNLTTEDFQLEEGNRVIPITFFQEVDERVALDESGIPIAEAEKPETMNVGSQGKAVVIYLDTSNISKRSFDAMKVAFRELVEAESSPGVLMKIIHFDASFNHLTDFTEDREELLAALDDIKTQGSFRLRLEARQSRVIDAYEDLVLNDDPDSAPYFRAILEDRLREKQESKRSHYDSYSNQMIGIAELLSGFPQAKSIYHLSGGIYLENGISGRGYDTNTASDQLAATLNRHNVTVYSFVQVDRSSVGDAKWRALGPQVQASNLGINNGLRENNYQLQTGPDKVAQRTGGFYLSAIGESTISSKLAHLRDSTRHYYRLAYTVEQDQAKKKIKITLPGKKHRKLDIKYGERFSIPKPFSKMNKEELQRNFESKLLFAKESRNDLNCNFQFQRFPGENGLVLIPTAIDLPVTNLPEKGFQIGMAAFGQGLYLHDVVQTDVVDLPKADGLRLHHVLVAKENPQRIRFMIRNLDSGDYSIHEALVAEDDLDRREELFISEVVLFQKDDYKLVPLNMLGEPNSEEPHAQIRRDRDPMVVGNDLAYGNQPESFRKKPVDVFFHLNNVVNPNKLSIEFFLVRNDQEKQIRIKTIRIGKENDNSYRFLGRVKQSDLEDGASQLVVKVSDVVNGQEHSRTVALSVEGS